MLTPQDCIFLATVGIMALGIVLKITSWKVRDEQEFQRYESEYRLQQEEDMIASLQDYMD